MALFSNQNGFYHLLSGSYQKVTLSLREIVLLTTMMIQIEPQPTSSTYIASYLGLERQIDLCYLMFKATFHLEDCDLTKPRNPC